MKSQLPNNIRPATAITAEEVMTAIHNIGALTQEVIIAMEMFVTLMGTTLETMVEELLNLDDVNNYFRAVCFKWFQNTLKATHF